MTRAHARSHRPPPAARAGLSGSARWGTAVLLVVVAGHASAQPPIPRPTAQALHLDGDLTDAAWGAASPIVEFLQREPAEGARPTQRTEARVLFDDTHIYVAVRAFDSDPAAIKAFLTRRDVWSASDWVRVYIDSYHDRRSAYSFAVNPLGVKLDTYHFNDTNEDSTWDAVWDVAVARDAEGWKAEFRIPLSQLRFSAGGDGRLGFAVARQVARVNETSTWPLLSRNAPGWVSMFGDLAGVSRAGTVKRLELVPYTLGQLRTTPLQPLNPLQHNPSWGGTLGADVKYAVTPAVSLTATVNPDFGQVEADPAVVNLSAYEVFFQERRPFFVEGSGTYSFDCRDCSLFYSRRIGRAPRGLPALQAGEFSTRPDQSTILGAAKLTGRARGFSLGVMTAFTQEERASIAFGTAAAEPRVAGGLPVHRQAVVEPRTFYSVSRARREFSDQSSVGAILTTTTRALVDSVSFLPASATTGGADVDWRLGRNWALTGYWAGSRVTGSADSIGRLQTSTVHSFQRPDAEHVELDLGAESLSGHSGNLRFGKLGGGRTRGQVNVGYRSPGFDPNDLGFMQRADVIAQNGWVQVRWDKPGRFRRSVNVNFNQWSAFNFDGDQLELGGNVNAHWQFQNQWSFGGGFNVNRPGVDDRLTRGGPSGRRNGNINSWQYFNTNDRKVVSVHWNSNFGNDFNGSRWFSVEPRLAVRPSSAMSAEIGINYNDSLNDYQWIGTSTAGGRTRHVFGRLDQKTTSLTARFNYTLSPTLSVQVYAQPFVSAGDYVAHKALAQPLARHYADRFEPFAYDRNADFNVLSFRTTNVLRWEYRPGSTLFVVWQQGREGFAQRGVSDLGRDIGDLFATPSTNTVLVKFAYWFNQ